MYIPKDYLSTDKTEIVSFMKRFPFALIITAQNNFPIATHLPFIIEEKEGEIFLLSHFAKANPQWKLILKEKSLVVFNEPHSYISPKNYEKELNVPTWNYLAVHASGPAEIIENAEQLLEKTISVFEQDYKNQWDKLPVEYKQKMYKGIVPFQIKVERMDAQKKLSQNKTEKERDNIISSLGKSEIDNERLIARYMGENETKLNKSR